MLPKASLAGLLGLASLASHSQGLPLPPVSRALDPLVVTATRGLTAQPTLRSAIVITREDLDAAGPRSLGEVLQRLAGVELAAAGGPGQPQGIFIRGSGAAQALVLVDGMRVGSAATGATAIQHIPLELVERIEVVKGPLSSLWGSDAMGGVVQIFTRGKPVPHLFASAAYGSDRDRAVATGITTIDRGLAAVLTMGYREVDAPSATTSGAGACHDPDRDPYDNAFANLRLAQRLWQGENVVFEAFGARGRAGLDGCGAERNEHVVAGARLTSSAQFAADWTSRLVLGQGRDRVEVFGTLPGFLETRQDHAAWINEVALPMGKLVGGVETVREKVFTRGAPFARDERRTDSLFASLTETWRSHHVEASWRRDDDDTFGRRDTGSLSYGLDLGGGYRLAATLARGFRVPTFADLYGPSSDSFQPNPSLVPERNRSGEVSLRSPAAAAGTWRITAFDTRAEDLIAFVAPVMVNVDRARIRGVEVEAEATRWNIRWRAAFTAQRPRDEDTGERLPGRAQRYGTLGAARTWGAWSAAVDVHASGDRHDARRGEPPSRLGAYATVDARAAYRAGRHWTVELTAVNLGDKRYETSPGYEGRARGVMLGVRFEAF